MRLAHGPWSLRLATSQTVEFAPLLAESKINRSFNGLAIFSSVPSIFVIGSATIKNAPEAPPPAPHGGPSFFSHNRM
jgi:hypothetical protein